MIAALGSLLRGIIDYAGLFPPAGLKMDRAIEIFTEDLQGIQHKLLRHFVLPAKRIGEFDSLRSTSAIDPLWTLSVLVGGGETLCDWNTALEDDLAEIESRHRNRERGTISVLEIALPTAMDADAASFAQAINEVFSRLANTSLADCDLFFETTSPEHRRALAEVLCKRQGQSSRVGLKVRTGGLKAKHFPSVGQLSDILKLCNSFKIPWKATAGLHHPLPHACPQIGATMHGFLNLLFAVVFLEAECLEADRLEDLLADGNADHFVFTESGLQWGEVAANLSQIHNGRERFISFGSCSFSEPVDDLAQLGLLSNHSSTYDS